MFLLNYYFMMSHLSLLQFDYLEDNVLNSSANRFKKTQVDVRSENASKFREMFDKGEAPEDAKGVDRSIVEKEAELELMRKGKRQQRDFFKKLESGATANEEDQGEKKEPKLLVGKLKSEVKILLPIISIQ